MPTNTLSQGSHLLLAALSSLWLIVSFRALPFVVYSLLKRGVAPQARLGVVLAYGALLALAGPSALESLRWWLIGFAYYGLCLCAVHWMTAGAGEIRGWHAGLLLCTAFGTFLLLPSVVFPRFALATFGVLG